MSASDPQNPLNPDNLVSKIRISRYTVSCLPENEPEAGSWDLIVEERGHGRWVVMNHGQCLKRNGGWMSERSGSHRDAILLRATRFDLQTALAIAEKYAPTVVINGFTPADLIEWRKTHPVAPGHD
jgi:hypothetical protein